MRIGVGIIGTGAVAERHAYAVSQLRRELMLIAMADPLRSASAQLGKRFFIPFYYSDARLLLKRNDIQLVVICTPPDTHEELIGAALREGKHVICEKPLAHSLESARRILSLADEFSGKLSICFQRRYSLHFYRLKSSIDTLKPLGLKELYHESVSTLDLSAIRNSWWGKWDIAGGGVVITRFIHTLDTFRLLLGPVSWVEASLEKRCEFLESEDSSTLKIGFADGIILRAVCRLEDAPPKSSTVAEGDFGKLALPLSHNQPGRSGIISIFGKVASKSARGLRRLMRLLFGFLSGRSPGKVNQQEGSAKYSHLNYYREITRAIQNGAALPVSASDAFLSQELVAAIYRSASLKERIALPLVENIGALSPVGCKASVENSSSMEI